MSYLRLMLILVLPVALWADAIREVKPFPITCVGVSDNKSLALSVVRTEQGGTRLHFAGALSKTIDNKEPLKVGSEGSVYIQQVSNDLGYNLFLSGKDLEDLLEGDDSKEYQLTGQIELFKSKADYKLTCRGSFLK
jgi:hypothetical protein